MKIYHLSEKKKKGQLIEIDSVGRFLVTANKIGKVEHTLIIDSPGIDSRIIQEFRRNAEDDNSDLENYTLQWIDIGEMIYLFWISEKSTSRLFGEQYSIEESNLW